METKQVYEAIAAVMSDLAKAGIGKDSENKGQGFKFRGIDAVYNALAPILSVRNLVILPRLMSRGAEVRDTKNGGTTNWVVVDMEFDLVSALDGSVHTVRTPGEAMDSGDKATNKAMSAAYKYMAFLTFCIPTEGDNDADATTHQLAAKPDATRDASEYLKTIGMLGEARKAFADDFGVGGQDAALIAKARGVAAADELTEMYDPILCAKDEGSLASVGGKGYE